MPLSFQTTVFLPTIAPGPYVEILVSGINKVLVPDPSVTDATTWSSIIAGTYSGISAPTTPAFWTRNTSTFATTPASLRVLTTTTAVSGKFYLTPWTPAQAGMQVQIAAAARVTQTDSSRTPGIRIEARDAALAPLTVNRISWPTTVNASFTTQTNTFALPTNTAEFRVFIDLEGTATNPMSVYFDDFVVILQPGATTLTVSRVWEGEETYIQGGYKSAVTGDTMLFYDYAAPFTTDVIYKAVTESTTALREQGQSAIVRVEADGVWISDPLSPEVALKITPDQASFKRKVKTRPGGPMAALTRKRRPAIVGKRQDASDMPMSILTYTIGQRLGVEVILDNVDPIMIRCSSDHSGMPALAYITFAQYEQILIDAPAGDTVRFSMNVDFVDAPSYDVVVPLRTYADYLNEFTSYGGTTWPTYLALLRGS